jgi:hypothetical protein
MQPCKEAGKMMTVHSESQVTESFEYHGNTSVEHIRRHGGVTILRDWIIFDSVEEAEAFFNDHRSEQQTVLH